ncbi:MAG TPA: SRPBCC domain-containing protein [Dehalococcoidia bacterium]|nr:SRPBCC domain-containing protein [Dehalococcoidia bacterium]
MTTEATAIEREVRIEASPETVFGFLIESDKMEPWMGSNVTLDPTPGGIYRCDINGRDIAAGEFVEVTPHSRVVYTWGWEGSPIEPGSSTVEITLTADGDATIVKLVHSDIPAPAREEHGQGWELYLGRLAVAATGGDPGADPNMA